MEKRESFRLVEIAAIVGFLVATALLVALDPSPGAQAVGDVPPSGAIRAYAYAMPHQGWAPLTVYFSPFGSQSDAGTIARYEWDLDGNGRPDTDATATGGYASYTYKKSGTYRISLKVTDRQGNAATDSVTVTVRYPASSSVDYWTVFDDSQVRRVEMRFTSSAWEAIWNGPRKARVPADVVLFGTVVKTAAVSFKGNASLDLSGQKKSWKVDTDYFVPGQEYRNLKQLLFNNNFADASLLREKMAYDMMAFAGVPAGHAAYVELWIDIVDDAEPAEYWGVYTMVERVDSKFVANRFGRDQGTGNLYKADATPDEGAADLAYYGPEIDDYPKPRRSVAYGLQTNLAQPDYGDIIRLCCVIDGVEYATPEGFAAALEGAFNVDGYLRYLAVIFTNLNLDTYPYTGNNFYLYDNPATGKFEFLPWDLNNSWGHFGGGAEFPLYGEPCCQGPLAWAPLFTKVFQVGQYRQDYAAYVELLVRFWLDEPGFSERAAAWQAMLAPYLVQATGDKAYVGADAQMTVDGFRQDGSALVKLTQERCAYLRSVLDSGRWQTEVPEANVRPAGLPTPQAGGP